VEGLVKKKKTKIKGKKEIAGAIFASLIGVLI
jgi:hypothetical protein